MFHPLPHIRAIRAGDAADGEFLAQHAGVVGVGVQAVPRVIARGVIEAPAAAQHAALVGPRGRHAVLRRAQGFVAIRRVGLQHVVAARLLSDIVVDVVVGIGIQRAAEQQLKGILGFTDEPNVSSDFNHDPRSSIFHMDQTKVLEGTLVRVMSWYDNEWGFSNRMIDTAVAMGKLV